MHNKPIIFLCCLIVMMFHTTIASAENQKKSLSSFMQDKDIAVLRSIDKLYARTSTFEVPVGQTVKFGNSLFIRPQACRKTPPTKQPESAAFLQIWESNKVLNIEEQSQWVFSGWMFASSPALSAMDHPIFDVWLIDCKNAVTVDKESSETVSETPPEASSE